MYLNKSFPLLFATPSINGSQKAIVYSIAILVLTILSNLASELWGSFPWFMVMSIFIGMHGYIALTTTGGNILFIFRYFLVWILIFGTSTVWFIYAGDVIVAPFGIEYQTANNTRLLVLAGLCSMCGSLVGWHIALVGFKYQKYKAFTISEKHRNSFKTAGEVIAIALAILYVWKSGGIVGGDITYSNREEGFSFSFGVFNIFHFIGISLLILGSVRGSRIEPRYLLTAIASLVLGMLTGSRADFLPQAAIILLLIFNQQIVKVLEEKKYIKLVKWFLVFVFVFFIALVIASFIAIWRSGLNLLAVLEILWSNSDSFFIKTTSEHRLLFFETGNMMLGGLYSAIVNTEQGLLVDNFDGVSGFLLGRSYLNYFLITPPAFLDLPRPLGLEWSTQINGLAMSQGGIFEVAEAYWNFGLLGCFCVSLFISYVFGFLLKRGLRGNNYFYLVWYIVYGLHGLRCVWYQNFSYFRLMTIMMLIYVLAQFLFKFFIVDRAMVSTLPISHLRSLSNR